jgi:5-methylcytosine-specific restriction protein A
MAWKSDKPCPAPGCPNKIPADKRYCEEHTRERSKAYEKTRESAYRRGYTKRWEAVAEAHLLSHPLCETCQAPAAEVDHVIPHKGNMKLFWDPKNRQSLCKKCHSRKTAIEDGRWEPKQHAE